MLTFLACQAQPSPVSPAQPATLSNSTPPTLGDFWQGRARFVLDVTDTGLPLGESDTLVMRDELWSYLHASYQSAGVLDQCGDKVVFPGCMIIMRSIDGGRSFVVNAGENGSPVCQMPCQSCPCDINRDHIDQQQYPRIARSANADQWLMTYEFRGSTFLRRSVDGLQWSLAEEAPLTGIWRTWMMPCARHERVALHPNTNQEFDCLVGSPPGIFLEEDALYIFVGLGQNPSGMGCYVGAVDAPAALMRKCDSNPLFQGASEYGPLDLTGEAANRFYDFRTISSADVIRVGKHYYLFYEGIRGATAGAAGDTQFGLGLARSRTNAIDGEWEEYHGNPILVDLPANVGLGHADVIVLDGITYLYTSLDGKVRSRLVLVRGEG